MKGPKTREEIITSMCYTYRHDYGMEKIQIFPEIHSATVGMDAEERDFVWNQMAQIFDNDILPYMDFKA